MYESNDNDDHTAESYMKEAKKHINEAMDSAYENYGSMDEAIVLKTDTSSVTHSLLQENNTIYQPKPNLR